MSKIYDAAIIGGGIVGTSTAMALQKEYHVNTIVIEAENELAYHQTGNNSGVIHSGIYYKPGSLKAENCVRGRELMYDFCSKHNIAHEKCGKLILAVSEDELPQLSVLEEKGRANGIKGIRRLRKDEIKDYEPHADGVAALFVPETGIVDYKEVVNTFAEIVISHGGEIKTSTRFCGLEKDNGNLLLLTNKEEIRAKIIVNCGGLQSDRITKLCGVKPNLMIVPFRGEYYSLFHEKENLVRNLIYPVPDPQFPFLGVHFTRMINGGVEAGPNAVLAFKREGYKQDDFSVSDIFEMAIFSGFWKMAMKHYKMGIGEFRRSFSKDLFVSALKKLVPEIEPGDIYRGGSGIRAQALEPDGKLVDDFRIIENEKMVHVLNAPSPAATASISIGKSIAGLVTKKL